jgi:tetratricopeptide (TPR) repeat protein
LPAAGDIGAGWCGCWETADVVFVVDAFGAWLVEQIADAGRKKLTELILGSEQDRALRQAAAAAIKATAAEFSPSGSEQAGQAAMVIGQVFSDPQPIATRSGPEMLLQGLQADIIQQLAVLDDAGFTGTGQSPAGILGVAGTVLADQLTGHLVREIIVRGSHGGPLTPLADQLNHELTRRQGQRVESKLDELAARLRNAQACPAQDSPRNRLGDSEVGHEAPPALLTPRARAWGPVPARNRAFTGREEQLTRIHDALLSGNRAAVQVLIGMGGVGKTQIVAEYAHRYANGYDIVWWLDADTTVLLGQQYAGLAEALGCAVPGTTHNDVRRAVLSDLHQRPRWLIIFDNAEDPGALRGWLPSGPGHVLITSRSAGWDELAVPVSVDVLTRNESVELLRNRVPALAAAEADTLAGALGDLPLALSQAAAYLAETRMRAAEYVTLLQERATDLLNEGKPATYPATLTGVTALAYDRLRSTDKDAADLAAICAFLAPEPIPVRWFTDASDNLPAELAARLADPLGRSQLPTALTRLSLARLDDNGLTIHRLTQAILRARSQALESGPVREFAEAVVTAGYPGDAEDPTTWPDWAPVLPHLLALDPAESASPDLRQLAVRAVWYLTSSGNAGEALNLATSLRERWSDRLSSDHLQMLDIANVLGSAHSALGHYAQACQLEEDILARRRRLHGDDHPLTLGAANNLAYDLREAGRYREARELNENTLKLLRQTLGDDHPDTLGTAINLATDLRKLGEHHAARKLGEDTLARVGRVLGDDYPDTLKATSNLAIDLRELGEHHAARELNEDTLARARRVLGDEHPDTLISARNLAGDD